MPSAACCAARSAPPIKPVLRASAPTLVALPATGFWALRVENQNVRPGVIGFYGGAYSHRATRACYKGQFGASPLCD